MTIEDQLKSLIDKSKTSRFVNEYIQDDNLHAYIRITKRHIEGKKVDTIDIANVTVIDENKHGTGIFKSFLKTVESLSIKNNKTVFVESVLSPFLIRKLPEYGYSKVQNSEPPCFVT